MICEGIQQLVAKVFFTANLLASPYFIRQVSEKQI